ncbi:MAG: energy-coupling factor transporter transmembrane protein EcfT [Oscillospiraceae bacterium]|nr:energy-coupling factor transporter transmembrane protein EcfT [Oscillospiraceae bacterium]
MGKNRSDAFSQYHPLVNFVFFMAVIGFTVVIQHPAYLAAGFAAGLCYYFLLYGKKALRFVLALIPTFFIIAAINPLFNTGGNTVLFTYFGRPYTFEALCYGFVVGAMFLSMIVWFGCYNQVLTSDKFTSLFGNLIPALSLLLVMILRLIPSFMRKATQIAGCRKSIGKGVMENSSFKEKLADGMTILSALTDWALEGSITTGDSMRARGYGAAKRSSFQIYRISCRDIVLLVLILLMALSVIMFANTSVELIPRLAIPMVNWAFPIYCLLFLIPAFLQIKEEILWHISISKI